MDKASKYKPTKSELEILMFYNPAVWWLSQTMRRERENCCDDIAQQAGRYLKNFRSRTKILKHRLNKLTRHGS